MSKGGFKYAAKASGTVSVPDGMFVKTIAAHASAVSASLTIDGGDAIPIPATSSATNGFSESFDAAREELVGPIDIVSVNTDALYVSWGP